MASAHFAEVAPKLENRASSTMRIVLDSIQADTWDAP